MIPTEEVAMRPPEVFVRPLAHREAVELKRMSKQAEHQCTRQRAAILLASNTRMSTPEIARMWMTDESRVRKVIHEFNERGLDSLRPNYRGGRPRRIDGPSRKRIVAVAGARPADYLDWEAFGFALCEHVRYRNGPHRDRRLAAAEPSCWSLPESWGFGSNVRKKGH
jgi:transposase